MSKNSQSELPGACLIVGIAMALAGITGKTLGPRGDIRITPLSGETRWISLIVGVIMTVLSILYFRKHKFIPPEFTDEEVRQAEEKLDQMYLRDHGALPQAPKADTPNANPAKPDPAQPTTATAQPAASQPEAAAKPKPAPAPPRTLSPEEEARAAKAGRKIRQGLLLMLAGVIVYYAAGNLFMLFLSPVLFMVGLCRAAVGAAEKP